MIILWCEHGWRHCVKSLYLSMLHTAFTSLSVVKFLTAYIVHPESPWTNVLRPATSCGCVRPHTGRAFVCVRVRPRASACVHVRCVHVRIIFVCVHVRASASACVRLRPRASICARVRMSASACVRLRSSACKRLKVRTRLDANGSLRLDASFVQGLSGCTIQCTRCSLHPTVLYLDYILGLGSLSWIFLPAGLCSVSTTFTEPEIQRQHDWSLVKPRPPSESSWNYRISGNFRCYKVFTVVSNGENFTHNFFSTTKHCNSLPDPRGSLLSSRPSQAIAAANREVEEPSSGNVGHTGSIVLTVQAEIGKYACPHSVTAPAAPRFRDKHGSHECTSLFHTPPRFLHMLNFCGRPIPWKFYCQMFALSDLPKKSSITCKSSTLSLANSTAWTGF